MASEAQDAGAEPEGATGSWAATVLKGPGSRTQTLGDVGPARRVGTVPRGSRSSPRAALGVFPL